MPIYTYRCEKCGHKWDDLRPVRRKDDPAKCPECGGAGVCEVSFRGHIQTKRSPFKSGAKFWGDK